MPCTRLTERPARDLAEALGRIRYVFTDLDGTMLAPGSTVMRDSQGRPSAALPAVLAELAEAGVEVVPCSGRNRAMLHEDCRMLGLNGYIGEMGGLVMADLKEQVWEYCTADMEYDPACGATPHEVIERTGICQAILDRWPGRVEYQNDMGTGYKHREVTVGYRGAVDDGELQAMLDGCGLALQLADNGLVNRISKPTSLHDLPEGTCRSLQIIPRGLDKGVGIARFMELRGIDPAETLSIGDAPSDFLMAEKTALFVCVENGLAHGETARLAEAHSALVSPGSNIDSWVFAMRALLACK